MGGFRDLAPVASRLEARHRIALFTHVAFEPLHALGGRAGSGLGLRAASIGLLQPDGREYCGSSGGHTLAVAGVCGGFGGLWVIF